MFPHRFRPIIFVAFLALFALVVPAHLPGRTAESDPTAKKFERFSPSAAELEGAYQRAEQNQPPARIYKNQIKPQWGKDDVSFWYRNDLRNGSREFILVDTASGKRGTAFDHAKVAEAVSRATGKDYKSTHLPFDAITFGEKNESIRFEIRGVNWSCDLTKYECEKLPASSKPPVVEKKSESFDDDQELNEDGEVLFQQPKRGRGAANSPVSPDKKWTTVTRDFNIFLRDSDGKETALTTDGKEGRDYGMIKWSPDSSTLVAFRIEPGDDKEVHLIESSPRGGGRAQLRSRRYPLPGDKFASYELHVFDAATRSEHKVMVEPIDLDRPNIVWYPDGHTFSYRKVDRGHQRFRLIEVDGRTGKSRNLIDEKTSTFIWTVHYDGLDFDLVTWLKKTNELIYASEKSGWRHFYLLDPKSGEELKPITSGDFVVRGIDRIDEEKRQLWFRASGKNPNQDPYFIHYYRVNFDGSDLIELTEGNGTHTAQFSPGGKYLIDTYSRIDKAPITELRSTSDGKLIAKLEEADIDDVKASGWDLPEVFSAKGRDGKTDIWGIICRPRNFDPNKKYPVIESIYAGPQGSFVQKAFSASRRFRVLNELGFVVVQMDGMGTANRSKAFHDVCWHNLKDAGFPDRILWHKAAAAKYPFYDISRVGIYGTSAGGQNAMGALLFHGDFYSAAVAACGCHDNRMDKASWNEQWMGYPVGPHYAASSNVDHAKNLIGKLLLIVGEQDTNVPPESTYRVVDALIKAGKDFDFLVVPGMGHSDGGPYGRRRLNDFFVRHLHGVMPPDRNNPNARLQPMFGAGQSK